MTDEILTIYGVEIEELIPEGALGSEENPLDTGIFEGRFD